MKDLVVAAAQGLAVANGAAFVVVPGAVYDAADSDLAALAQALLTKVAGTGIELTSLRRVGSTLYAGINDSAAEEPLCRLAFGRVVRRLSFDLLGEAWDAHVTFAPVGTPAPAAAAVRVA